VNSIRVLLVDDEPRARRRMRRLLEDHPDVEVVGEAEHGDGLFTEVLRLRPQLVFADIQMPGTDGLAAVKRVRDTLPEALQPLVVFTTAFDQHAVDAFSVEGLDYLLKPVDRDGLARALRRVRRAVYVAPATSGPAPDPAPPAADAHLAVHRAGRVVPVALDDVALVEIEDTITFVFSAEGRFRLRGGLHEVEARLPQPPFVRVSRSSIVNLSWIDKLEPGDSGTWTATLKDPCPKVVGVARRRVRQLRDLLGGF
jgi:two-component system response regulator AlgR